MARPRIDPLDGDRAIRATVAATRRAPGEVTPGEVTPGEVDRATERLAVRYALQLLTDRAPGHSVEVRIPPLAAAQAIPGPAHRRGTPAAVIEMDPRTWLGLATGRLTWDSARSSGRIRASGERADLSPWLPLLEVP